MLLFHFVTLANGRCDTTGKDERQNQTLIFVNVGAQKDSSNQTVLINQ